MAAVTEAAPLTTMLIPCLADIVVHESDNDNDNTASSITVPSDENTHFILMNFDDTNSDAKDAADDGDNAHRRSVSLVRSNIENSGNDQNFSLPRNMLISSESSSSSSESSSESSSSSTIYHHHKPNLSTNLFFLIGSSIQLVLATMDLRGARADARWDAEHPDSDGDGGDDDGYDDDDSDGTKRSDTSFYVYLFLYSMGPTFYLLNAIAAAREAVLVGNDSGDDDEDDVYDDDRSSDENNEVNASTNNGTTNEREDDNQDSERQHRRRQLNLNDKWFVLRYGWRQVQRSLRISTTRDDGYLLEENDDDDDVDGAIGSNRSDDAIEWQDALTCREVDAQERLWWLWEASVFGLGASLDLTSSLLNNLGGYYDDSYKVMAARVSVVSMHVYLMSGVFDLPEARRVFYQLLVMFRRASSPSSLSTLCCSKAFILHMLLAWKSVFYVVGASLDCLVSYIYDPDLVSKTALTEVTKARCSLSSCMLWFICAVFCVTADVMSLNHHRSHRLRRQQQQWCDATVDGLECYPSQHCRRNKRGCENRRALTMANTDAGSSISDSSDVNLNRAISRSWLAAAIMTWFAWNDESAFSVPLLLGPEAIA